MNKKPFVVLTLLWLALRATASAWYDPHTQSFLSRDPIREAGGINLYAYCNNDPVGHFDPIGLDPSLWFDTMGMSQEVKEATAKNNVAVTKAIATAPYHLGNYAGEQGIAAHDLALATGSSNAWALTLATGVTLTRVTGALDLIEATAGGQQIVGDSQSGLQMQDFSGPWQRTFHGVGGGLQLFGTATAMTGGAMRLGNIFESRIPVSNPSLIHLTNPEAKVAILGSSPVKIGGRWGVFALDASQVPNSNFGRVAKTLVPGDLSAEVSITGDAVTAFRKPPLFGPFSAARRLAGVRSTSLGSIDLSSGTFLENEIFTEGIFRPATRAEIFQYQIHQFTLDYGVDLGIYGIGGLGGAAWYNSEENQ